MRRHGIDDYWELVAAARRTTPSGSGRRRSRTWGSSSRSLGRRSSTLSRGPEWATWFVGGKLNIAWNCVHRWAARAARRDSRRSSLGEDGARRELTFAELSREVTRLAEALVGSASSRATGSRSSCRCRRRSRSPRTRARTSARSRCRSSPGFAAPAVAQRLAGSEAKVAITRRRRCAAAARCRCSRSLEEARARTRRRSSTWSSRRGTSVRRRLPGRARAARELDSEHPYLLTYTSGTTGKPKGVLHVQGGFLVSIAREVAYQADARRATSSTSPPTWAGSWARGRWSAAARMGATIVFAEGAPDWPTDRLWQTGRGRSASRSSGSRRRSSAR